jgi:hypothetical protein
MQNCPFWKPAGPDHERFIPGYCTASVDSLFVPSIDEIRRCCRGGGFKTCPRHCHAPRSPAPRNDGSMPFVCLAHVEAQPAGEVGD